MPKNKARLNTNKVTPTEPKANGSKELPITADAKRRKKKNLTLVVASVILAVIIGVSVFGWWLVYEKPLKESIATVNGENVSVDYILRRCLWSITNSNDPTTTTGTADPLSIIQEVIQDKLVEQVASKPPYNIVVTDADIDQALRDQANASMNGSSTTDSSDTTTTTAAITDSEYQEWYRQTLNMSQLSNSEFRDYVKAKVMAQKLTAYLVAKMSLNVPQVHIYDIIVSDSTSATDIQTRINNGEDFQTIAKELSLDSTTKDQGGDMGWVPIDVLKSIDNVIGSTAESLEVGQVSYPVQMTSSSSSSSSDSSGDSSDQPYYLLLVTEKNPAMPVTNSQYISVLQGLQLQNWLNEQMDSTKTKNVVKLHGHGQNGGFDSSTNAWILYQIEKLKRSRGIKDATTTTTATDPITGQ